MSTPQPGQSPYVQQESYTQEEYDASQHDGVGGQQPAQHGPPSTSAAGRKKRGYAGQAYEFGGGANSALGGQQQGGGAYPPPPGAGYGGYGQQQQSAGQTPGYGAPQPAYGSGSASPAVGAAPGYGQQPGAVGGYQPPEPGYPAQGTHGQPPPGVGGITQGMGGLAVAGQGQHHAQGRLPMNQLYPTDMLNSALNVTDLDLPPPPIILPANVRFESLRHCSCNALTDLDRFDCLARRELPSQIRSLNSQCCTHYTLSTQKIKTALRLGYTAIWLAT